MENPNWNQPFELGASVIPLGLVFVCFLPSTIRCCCYYCCHFWPLFFCWR